MPEVNENERTNHGDAIGNQIQDEDAFGYSGAITASDTWYILDNLQSQLIDMEREKLLAIVTKWMREIEEAFPDMTTT